MQGINQIILAGRLGHDPEYRSTPSGRTVCDIRIATNRPTKTESGWTESTDWHRVRLWEKQADVCLRLLRKGSPVMIQGQLRTDQWTDQSGQNRARSFVHCNRLHLLPTAVRLQDQVVAKAAKPDGEAQSEATDN